MADIELSEIERKNKLRTVLSDFIFDKDSLSNLIVPPRVDLISKTHFDNILPIYKDSLTLVAAPPKSGKSLLLLHLALNLANMGNTVLYLSLENTLRQDKERIDKALDVYQFSLSDYFFYVNKDDIPSQNIADCVYNYISLFEFDVIFVDATEKIISLGENGAEISKNGKQVLDNILKSLRSNPNRPAIVASWQYSKQFLNADIDDVGLDSLGGSISAVQMADSIWSIIKNKREKKWSAKLLASREDYDVDTSSFSVLDDNGLFNIKCECFDLLKELKNYCKSHS